MAHTLVNHIGQSTTPSITGTESQYVIGPPVLGALKTQGRYIWQSGATPNRTYRWVADEPITSASPSTYMHTPSN